MKIIYSENMINRFENQWEAYWDKHAGGQLIATIIAPTKEDAIKNLIKQSYMGIIKGRTEMSAPFDLETNINRIRWFKRHPDGRKYPV